MIIRKLEIEIYDLKDNWEQARYLYHGIDDIGWTDDVNLILEWIREDLEK